MEFTSRVATVADAPALRVIMDAAIEERASVGATRWR